MSIEIMINESYGGFGYSTDAIKLYRARTETDFGDVSRHDPDMIAIVKEMGASANGFDAKISICEIPAKFENYYEIRDYDGNESITILYDKYRIDVAKAILRSADADRVERALAVLEMKDEVYDEEF